jgi:acetyltransferase-like isoleucine patch superfamily enzyme
MGWPTLRYGASSSAKEMSSVNVFAYCLYKARRARIHYGLWRFRRAGGVMGERCLFADLPGFGAEPYLISLGNDVAMAAEVSFITKDGATHVFRNDDRYRKVIKYGHINILDNCVIGERTILLPGVTIGPDSVVAAGSVVARSVPPGVLAAGNPAKPVMTIKQYAEWSLAATPEYDEAEFARDKKGLLARLALRGSTPKRYHR